MERNRWWPRVFGICLVSFFVLILCRIDIVQAFTLGKTYDSKNWQEIEGIAPPFLANWVKSGEFILGTGALQFEFELEKTFLEASRKNLGKFDTNEEGVIVDKKSGNPPEFIYGLPFPRINSQDPKAGEKIAANYSFAEMRLGGHITPSRTTWIGKEGSEREMVSVRRALFYQGRPGDPLHNKNNFLEQGMMNVVEPMSLKDVAKMWWKYNDRRSDTNFAYVASLRRFQRTSPSARSESQFGTDMGIDDEGLWNGINWNFKWRLIGEKKVLCAFLSPNRIIVEDMPEGSMKFELVNIKLGYMDPNWKGASYAPVNITWSPRDVWIVEAISKNPAYNYGKQFLYVDKSTFAMWLKEIYDRSGEYWKSILGIQSFQVTPSGRTNLIYLDAYLAIDDRTKHSTYHNNLASSAGVSNVLYCPTSMLGPKDFNLNAVQQLSK